MWHRGVSRIGVVLIVLVIAMVLALIGFWLISGGAHSVANTVRSLGNPVDIIFHESTTTYSIRLPWQPATVTRGPDITKLAEEGDKLTAQIQSEEQSGDPGSDVLYAAPSSQTFGSQSPAQGSISIEDGDGAANDPSREYIRISNSGSETVDLTGYSLQSAISGLRAYIPGGTDSFTMGTINAQSHILLEPGASAIISSGQSPVGISFRENACTGYLGSVQQYQPPLMNTCPSPADALPPTQANVKNYGSECISYVQNLPSCFLPTRLPSSLSSTCRTFIASTFTYAGCAHRYASMASFALPSWRIYLGLHAAIWYDTHDTIRLLDQAGRVVDTFSY